MKSWLLIILSTIALTTGYYNARAFLPVVGSYPQRLEWFNGWPSEGYYAFNCSGLIAYAHGDDWTSEQEMYAGDHGKFTLIKEFSDVDHVDTSLLQAGDVIVFAGSAGNGQHVIAYLGHDTWIDSDSRRGYVAKYHSLFWSKNAKDPWFSGRARAFRWNTPARIRFHPGFLHAEQDAMLKE